MAPHPQGVSPHESPDTMKDVFASWFTWGFKEERPLCVFTNQPSTGYCGRACNHSNGFTLLELICVIALFIIVLLVVFPRLSGLEDMYLKSESGKVRSLIQYVHDMTSTKRVFYRIWFDIDEDILRVETSKDGTEYIQEPDARLRRLVIRDADIVDMVLPGAGRIKRGEVAVVFSPWGDTEPFVLHLKGGGHTITIRFNPFTGRVRTDEGYLL